MTYEEPKGINNYQRKKYRDNCKPLECIVKHTKEIEKEKEKEERKKLIEQFITKKSKKRKIDPEETDTESESEECDEVYHSSQDEGSDFQNTYNEQEEEEDEEFGTKELEDSNTPANSLYE